MPGAKRTSVNPYKIKKYIYGYSIESVVSELFSKATPLLKNHEEYFP